MGRGKRPASPHVRAEFAIVTSVAFNHDGSRLAVGNWDKTVRLFDLATEEEAITLRGHTDMVMSVTFSPDGQQIASASLDGTIRVWDAEAGEAKTNPENCTLRGQGGAVFRGGVFVDGKRRQRRITMKLFTSGIQRAGDKIAFFRGIPARFLPWPSPPTDDASLPPTWPGTSRSGMLTPATKCGHSPAMAGIWL